jgi:condensin complex subunit 1
MAKLMCVSSDYCEVHLPLLITIMERSSDPIVRSNTVIALGDMAVCFNHLIDENTDFLYRRLQDPEDSVKRTCLMTLTFLILAGQVKVKGQLGEMAKCLEDGDKRIADLARMFFTELATKDNAVYNNFVDMFSRLSASRELGEEGFRRVVKFLASFVEKVCLALSGVSWYWDFEGRGLTWNNRINMLNNYRKNLQRDFQDAKRNVNGMMWRLRCRYCRIRMRRLRKRLRRGLGW